MKPRSSVARVIAVVLGAAVPVAIACFQWKTPYPTIWSPLPLLVVLPEFWGVPMVLFLAIPLTYLALIWPLIHSETCSGVPVRYVVVLAIASAFSLLYLCYGTSYSVAYFGADYVVGVWIINAVASAALWGLWAFLRRRTSWFGVLVLGILLHTWLFGWAFPYMGELP
jgi:hypothetical protein